MNNHQDTLDLLPDEICDYVAEAIDSIASATDVQVNDSGILSDKGILKLNRQLEDFAVSEHRKRRGKTLTEYLGEPVTFSRSIEKVVRRRNESHGSGRSLEWTWANNDINVTISLALLGIHSVRWNEQHTIVRQFLDMCQDALRDGTSREKFLPLNVAYDFVCFGESRYPKGKSTDLPNMAHLNSLLEQAILQSELLDDMPNSSLGNLEHLDDIDWLSEALSLISSEPVRVNKKEDLDDFLIVLLFLIEAVALLPPYCHYVDKESDEPREGPEWSSVNYGKWLETAAAGLRKATRHARAHHHISRIHEGRGNVPDAIMSALDALQSAPAHDPGLTEEYRLHLKSLEQRMARDLRLDEEIREKVDESLDVFDNNLEKAAEDTKEDIQRTFNSQLEETTEDLRDEIRGALLRVVEILGVFLAVVAVAASTVGGLSPDFDLWEQILVLAVGYLAIVSLFFVLHWIVTRRIKSEDRHRSEASH